jgi:iron complex outermembrane receptor protein
MHRYASILGIAVLLHISIVNSMAMPGNSSLKGYVKDKTGHPMEGAIVAIPDLKAGTVADSNGYYFLANLPSGKYVVVASMISYSKTSLAVSVNGTTVQDFLLTESAIESKEVVITGQSKATEIKRSPVPVVAITNEFLRTNISSNIIDALKEVPGVATVTTGPNISKPFIRGLGYNRVLTLYDGMRIEGQQWGDEHGIEVDQYSVDRVELVKGPASLIYGSDALAGVVNLIPTPPPPDGRTIGNVTTEYQSNNNLAGGSAMLSGSHKGDYWLGRVSHKQAMDYGNPVDGKVYGTNFNETDASAAFVLNRKWGFAHLNFSMFNDLQAVPDGSRDSATRQFTKQIIEADTFRPTVTNKELHTYKIPTLHQHVELYRFMSANNFHVFNGLLVVNAGYERSVRREYSHPENAEIPGLYLQLNTYTYDIKYHLTSLAGWDLTAGINGMYQVNDPTKGTNFVIPAYRQLDLGPFAVFKKNIGKIDIAGGIRYDNRTFHNDALYSTTDPATGFMKYAPAGSGNGTNMPVFPSADYTFSGMTFSLGTTYVFSKELAVKANIARGFRAPNIAEISANGVHPGTNIYQLGNPDLKPEFSLQEDIGLEFTLEHVSVSISVFNNDLSNYIYNTQLDSVYMPGNQTFKFVAANASLYGGEASIDIHPHPLDWLHFENSISVVYAVNQGGSGINIHDSNRYLPNIPPVHGITELRAAFQRPSKWLLNAYAKMQLAMYAPQNRVYLANNTETPTSGYTLLNVGVGADITNKAGKVLFNIGIFGNNLADVAYQEHLSRLKYFEPYPDDPRGRHGIYNMGRNFGLKVSIPIAVNRI